jgi:hypothetical protein
MVDMVQPIPPCNVSNCCELEDDSVLEVRNLVLRSQSLQSTHENCLLLQLLHPDIMLKKILSSAQQSSFT